LILCIEELLRAWLRRLLGSESPAVYPQTVFPRLSYVFTDAFGGTNFPLIRAVLHGLWMVSMPWVDLEYAGSGDLSHRTARKLITTIALELRVQSLRHALAPTPRRVTGLRELMSGFVPATTPESPRPLGIPRPPLRASGLRCLRGRGTAEAASPFLSPPGR
jgi:hypothetical protein